jgi:hypothetical protein
VRTGAPTLTKLDYQKRLRGAGLTPTEYMVLVTMLGYANADLSNARPGHSRVAEDTALDERTVRRVVGRLADKGYLMLSLQGGNVVGRGMANVYMLTLPRHLRLVHKGGSSAPLDDEDGGHQCPPKGGTSVR